MIRPATLADVKVIHSIIAEQAQFGHILPRALSEIYSQLRDFKVMISDASDELIGCGALKIVWEDLAEVRSLAVRSQCQGLRIGSKLVESLLQDARDLGIKKVFVLTYRPNFFERLGFVQMDKGQLPHKIWADCIRCTKFPECGEIALVRSP